MATYLSSGFKTYNFLDLEGKLCSPKFKKVLKFFFEFFSVVFYSNFRMAFNFLKKGRGDRKLRLDRRRSL